MPTDINNQVRIILHPTDFSPASNLALAHALRLALTNQAELRIYHVSNDAQDDDWEQFPSVREILSQWGMIPKDAGRSAVTALGIQIEKIIDNSNSVADAIEQYCGLHPIDMIVLSTTGRDGIFAWIKPSTAENIATKVASMMIPVLFVPANCKGCVSLESGSVAMEHILVPVDHEPDSDAALDAGLRALDAYGSEKSNLTLLHVGSAAKFPRIAIDEKKREIQRIVRQGHPAAEILNAAEECDANLIIMVTAGTHGWKDAIRGTTTAQVLREAKCPVLAIPSFG